MASSGKAGKVKEWFAENYPQMLIALLVIGTIVGFTFLGIFFHKKAKEAERIENS